MIYLTFDSNIWIYLLDESWKEDNSLDYIEHWVNEGHVQLLLPKIIITEWDNNKEKEKENRKKKLREFFSMADEILPTLTNFINEYRKPEELDKIIELQFNRIENLLKKDVKEIEISDEIINKTIERSVKKEAPMHKNKNSIADTIIILSLLEFIEQNQSDEYCFISENTDDFFEIENKKNIKSEELIEQWNFFKNDLNNHIDKLDTLIRNYCEKAFKFHTDLTKEFSKYKFKDFRKIIHLVSYLKKTIPTSINLENIRKRRLNNFIRENTFNPDHERLVKDLPDSSYIENIKHLEIILNKSVPTKEEAKFTIALIDTDKSYVKFFYKKVGSLVWFKILKNKGVFKPENIPLTSKTNEGFVTPYWEPLYFLEKLSIGIKEGKANDLIDEIIEIILRFSRNPINNFFIWQVFTKILINLPNDKISKDILNYIPIWLKNSSSTYAISKELCEKLLPKFLSDPITKEDIEKAEILLNILFSIEEAENINYGNIAMKGKGYRSRIDMFPLVQIFDNSKIVTDITKFCSDDIIIQVANNLKKYLYDFPNGINLLIKYKKDEYNIKAIIKNKNLSISFFNNKQSTILGESIIENFEELDEELILKKLKILLKSNNIKYSTTKINKHNINVFVNEIVNGSNFLISRKPISELYDEIFHLVKVDDVFLIILRNLLNASIKENENKLPLLRLFAFNNYYRNPIYLRLVFFVIGNNWEKTKSIFWELVQNFDTNNYFSKFIYQPDLYEFLNKVQFLLKRKEKDLLKEIFKRGPQNDSSVNYPEYVNHWRFRWYSALRETEPFKKEYEKYSHMLNMSYKYFEDKIEVFMNKSAISPFTLEEIDKKDSNEIVQYILNFKPKDHWEKPNISGLAETLAKAVEENPQRFSEEIHFYNDVYYIYIYYILNAFKEAWKNRKSFDWEKVLQFCTKYIENEKFYSNKLILQNDSWGATNDWVIGSIANLLTEGMQSDGTAFDLKLLPIAKKILIKLVNNLKPVSDISKTEIDYPTYSYNSTSGKVLRALLDYSLRRARNLQPTDGSTKWEADIKKLFENTLKNEIIDVYILMGWYFNLFYFLDSDWIKNKIISNINLKDREWYAFIGGYAFTNPSTNKEINNLFHPHYERLIEDNIEKTKLFSNGIIRHLVAFYFWGLEDIKEDGLLLKFLNKAKPNLIIELIDFIYNEKAYYYNLNPEESVKFEELILQLWSFLAKKFEKYKNPDEEKLIAELIRFMIFIPKLNNDYYLLISKSIVISDKYYHTIFIIEKLKNLKNKDVTGETAEYIGKILKEVPFREFFSTIEKTDIKEIVIFLFEKGQTDLATEICENITRQEYDFLIEVYKKYK